MLRILRLITSYYTISSVLVAGFFLLINAWIDHNFSKFDYLRVIERSEIASIKPGDITEQGQTYTITLNDKTSIRLQAYLPKKAFSLHKHTIQAMKLDALIGLTIYDNKNDWLHRTIAFITGIKIPITQIQSYDKELKSHSSIDLQQQLSTYSRENILLPIGIIFAGLLLLLIHVSIYEFGRIRSPTSQQNFPKQKY